MSRNRLIGRNRSATALVPASISPLFSQNKRKRELCRISSTLAVTSTTALKQTGSQSRNLLLHRPSRQQLRQLFVCSAIPMVGFGFMDNIVMITAGSYVDATLGVTLGVSTLTAAALGNAVSDVSGVLFGGVVERTLSKFKYAVPPPLTESQRALTVSRSVKMAGSAIGVFVGCLLGASTLFFGGRAFDKDHGDINNDSNKALVEKLVQMHVLDNLEQTSIYYSNHSSVWSDCAKKCRNTGKPVHFISSANPSVFDDDTSIMCVPVLVNDNETKVVVAVLEYLRSSAPFTKQDENIAAVVANAASLLLSETQNDQNSTERQHAS